MAKYKGYSIVKRGSSYRIIVSMGRDSNGKQIQKTTTYKPDRTLTPRQQERAVERFAMEFEDKVRKGLVLDGEKMTFAEFIERWKNDYAAHALQPTTLEGYSGLLEKRILPYIGHYKLAQLQPLHLQSFYNDLTERGYERNGKHMEYTAGSLKKVHAVISSVMKQAVQWQIIDSNPCLRVSPPKPKSLNENIKYWTAEQAQTFLSELDRPYTSTHAEHERLHENGTPYHVETYTELHTVPLQFKVFFYIALFGGLRRGENLALTWDDIDFLSNTVSVTKSTAVCGNVQIVKEPKNKSSDRIVRLPDNVMELLHQHKLEQAQYRLSIGSQWADTKEGKPCNWLYTQWNGRQMNLATPYHNFQKIIKRYNARVTPDNALPVIPLHGLRHTSATLLISQHVDVRTVSGRLGHAQTSTTMNIYAHSLREADNQAAEALENLFERKAK